MTPIYIFDLDGTISLLSERREKLIKDTSNPHRWREFYAACDTDLPNKPVIQLIKYLRWSGADIFIWSARSDEVSAKTINWLNDHVGIGNYQTLRMRPEGNTQDDRVIKTGYWNDLAPEQKARVAVVFDDRDKVVKMWRDMGLTCLQVAPGDF